MTTTTSAPTPDLMTPVEVAAAFRVSPRTVTRWAKAGLLPSVRTLGGHRRFRRADVEAALAEVDAPVPYTPTELAAVTP